MLFSGLMDPESARDHGDIEMGMIPDQVMDAIHFADFVMAKEKDDRIGSSAATV